MPPHDFRLHPPEARLLEGRRALVTGATSGIGQGTAFELAAHGAAVAINHRGKVDDWRAMAAAIEAAGRRADETEGAIVMISSVHEVIPWEQFSHYCASKGGMKLFASRSPRSSRRTAFAWSRSPPAPSRPGPRSSSTAG